MSRIRAEWRYGALYGVKLLKGKGTRCPGRRFALGFRIIVEYLDLTYEERVLSLIGLEGSFRPR